jgi:hypothetical protein
VRVTPTRIRERLRRIGVEPADKHSESDYIGRVLGQWFSRT